MKTKYLLIPLILFNALLANCEKSRSKQQQHEETIAFIKGIGGNITFVEQPDNDLKTVHQVTFSGSADELARVTDEALSRLREIGPFKYFGTNGVVPFTDDGIGYLAEIESLEELYLWGAGNISDKSFEHIGRMKNLVALNASFTGSTGHYKTGTGLSHLAGLKKLRTLWLSHLSKLEGKNLASLRALSLLEKLYLEHDPLVSDTDLAFLSDLTNLKLLHLNGTPLTDACIRHLAAVQSLEELNLSETKVTDAGLSGLKALKKLKKLNLKKNTVSDAGVADLQSALPSIQITR